MEPFETEARMDINSMKHFFPKNILEAFFFQKMTEILPWTTYARLFVRPILTSEPSSKEMRCFSQQTRLMQIRSRQIRWQEPIDKWCDFGKWTRSFKMPNVKAESPFT
jgi:hypothetical protein